MQALREGADGADHEEPHPRLLLLLRHGPDLPKPVQATLVFFPWLSIIQIRTQNEKGGILFSKIVDLQVLCSALLSSARSR